MKTIGVIGLGNMGSGMAKNLITAGFVVVAHDILAECMQDFVDIGGQVKNNAAEVGASADAVFVMVMNGDQVKSVVDELKTTMKPGGAVILTATVHATEACEIAAQLEGTELDFIDSPVSGGRPGAHSGALTLMASAPTSVMQKWLDVLQAVSSTIHHVGEAPGVGQTVKGCLQSVIGSICSATLEASVLAAKAGVDADALYNVLSTSAAGCGVTNAALSTVIDREFQDTGSHISTMYRDLTISMDLARTHGVPLFTASTAMQMFQAGIARYPDADNQAVARIGEEIVGVHLERSEPQAE